MKQLVLAACLLFALHAEAADPVRIDISNCGAGFESTYETSFSPRSLTQWQILPQTWFVQLMRSKLIAQLIETPRHAAWREASTTQWTLTSRPTSRVVTWPCWHTRCCLWVTPSSKEWTITHATGWSAPWLQTRNSDTLSCCPCKKAIRKECSTYAGSWRRAANQSAASRTNSRLSESAALFCFTGNSKNW